MSPLLKNLIVVIVIALVGGFVYYVVTSNSAGTPGATSQSDQYGADLAEKSTKILAQTKKIERIKLDTDVLHEARFVSLQKSNIDLGSIPDGRTNPFDPIR